MTVVNEHHSKRSRALDALWPRLTMEERLALSGHFNADSRSRLRECIVRLFPGEPLHEWKFRFVQAQYGEEIASRFRAWFSRPENLSSFERWRHDDGRFADAQREVESSRIVERKIRLSEQSDG